jgi:hypothetical protein
MSQKNKAVNPAESAIKDAYLTLIQRTIHSIDALVYELENEGLHNSELREHCYELAVDCVPLIKKLGEAKRYAQGSLTHFQ